MVLGSVGRDCCKKKLGVRIFGQNFWVGCLRPLRENKIIPSSDESILRIIYNFSRGTF